MSVTKLLTVAIDFHIMETKEYYESQWLPSTLLLPIFFKIYSYIWKVSK